MSSQSVSTVATPLQINGMDTPTQVSTPTTEPDADSDYGGVDDGGLAVSSAMREEEARYKEESKRADEEEARNNINAVFKDVPDERLKRLQFLIKQSTVYSSILMEKLTKQQEEQRGKAEKAEKTEKEKN